MTNKIKRPYLFIATLALLTSACGVGSHFGTEPDEFRYTPPHMVSDEDESHCTIQARSAAARRGNELTRSKGMENTAIFGGLVGSIGVLSYIYEAEESAYKEGFESCLADKGYQLD